MSTRPRLPDPAFVWQVMALSATFAGNFLLTGSMANLIGAERAEARGSGWATGSMRRLAYR